MSRLRGLFMKSALAICCCLLLAGFPLLAASAGRIGDAQVRAGANGEPCFTIAEREERLGTPNFDAVTVTEAAGRRALMWRMAMPADRTFPVTFGMCVPYAGRVPALPQTPAGALEPGKVYYVRIDARRTRGAAIASAYDARFCLARQRDGKVAVHHIGRDDREGRRLFGCLPAVD
jgi:hypothetical protein